jgi:hemerythrin-like domain-containing protein
LTPEQSRLLATLAADHRRAQEAVGNLKVATARLLQGHDDALAAILAALDLLIRLYPRHLALEEEALFPLVELYLSPAEQEALAAQVQACAQHHEAARFADVVAAWEARGCKCHL